MLPGPSPAAKETFRLYRRVERAGEKLQLRLDNFAKVSRKLWCCGAKERKESCANMKRKSGPPQGAGRTRYPTRSPAQCTGARAGHTNYVPGQPSGLLQSRTRRHASMRHQASSRSTQAPSTSWARAYATNLHVKDRLLACVC